LRRFAKKLEALLKVERKDANEREQDHRDRVGGPALFDRLVDPEDLVDPALNRPNDRREEDPLAFHDLAHVAAEGTRQKDGNSE